MEIKKTSQKGQAAVTDALYFLMIVTFLSIFLFSFGNTYGNSVRSQISDESDTSFVTNALKAILYSSTPRDAKQSISDPKAEIDSLLALLKEDYADDETIDAEEREVFAKTISSIMSPVQDTKDYILTLAIPPESGRSSKYIFIFIHTTNFLREAAYDKYGKQLPQSFVQYKPDPTKSHIDYFCGLNNDSDFATIQKNIKKLVANVGPTSQASASIKMIKHATFLEKYNAQIDLIMWDATWLGKTSDVDSGILYESEPKTPYADWGCSEAGTTKTATP
jgi:hypothetical protein